jgi:hypothetical protein
MKEKERMHFENVGKQDAPSSKMARGPAINRQ